MKAKLSLFVSLLNLCVIVWYLAWLSDVPGSESRNFTLFMVCNSEAF